MQAMQLQAGRGAAQQAEAFARQLHGAWGVGRAGCDDGVLLLLSVQDRQARPGTQGRAIWPLCAHPGSICAPGTLVQPVQ